MLYYSDLASKNTVAVMAAKPMRSVAEKLVPSHRAENTVAETGSAAASVGA